MHCLFVCMCVFPCRRLQCFRETLLRSLSNIHDNGQTALASEPLNKVAAHYKCTLTLVSCVHSA